MFVESRGGRREYGLFRAKDWMTAFQFLAPHNQIVCAQHSLAIALIGQCKGWSVLEIH